MAFLRDQHAIREYLIGAGLKKFEPKGDYYRIKPGFEKEQDFIYYDLEALTNQQVVWVWENRLSVYRRNFENFHKKVPAFSIFTVESGYFPVTALEMFEHEKSIWYLTLGKTISHYSICESNGISHIITKKTIDDEYKTNPSFLLLEERMHFDELPA